MYSNIIFPVRSGAGKYLCFKEEEYHLTPSLVHDDSSAITMIGRWVSTSIWLDTLKYETKGRRTRRRVS
jgi:hypothetical protein